MAIVFLCVMLIEILDDTEVCAFPSERGSVLD